ncbi:class A rhodopsin-like G-protein coupled receptor GPRnna4, putative [Pediculus humanus corporis]|uniref:Class A rhodopsin-like G-protein coupled receptor GPRnna4, putative n=1 Tax=Pediculus humanus subsp. corporis TaxID=121224 RepID=E0V9L2_PEDHC|nr:class A rhodopsin-like G-protein coupled receptor GPRnna4, putative [Pediculus humanus corporis]EEB10068.1 class A rhodopsin-like G-protein coupled receptor GPRnna4, putative [Pediculus humanus corporis]
MVSAIKLFVLSLVAANFISVLGLVPVVLYLFSKNSLDCLSQFGSCLPVLVVTASVFSILIIAIDRYNAVLSPLHYSMTITSQRNKETIAAIWSISILLSIPPLLGVFNKRISYSDNEILRFSYAIVLSVFGFIIPLFALVLVYSRMYIAAHKNSERTRRQSIQANAGDCSRGGSMDTQFPPPIITTLDFVRTSKPPMLSQIHKRRISNASFSAMLFREEGRAVKTAVMVVASFLMCWAPFFILLLLSTFKLVEVLTHTTLFLGVMLIVSNSVLSPFIYVFRNEIAKNEAVRLLFWWKRIGLYEGNVLQQANKELKLKSSDGRIRIRHQSSSNYDSMSVQSFQLPINYSVECKQCSEPSNIPVADFIATYEVVNMNEELKKDGDEIKSPEGKTKGESVTFRLAFLPQKRCQTCIRQNSDSSSGNIKKIIKLSMDQIHRFRINENISMSSFINIPKKHRHKLQRHSAVEDEENSTKGKINTKYTSYDFG